MIDGEVVAIDNTVPYEFNYTIAADADDISLSAVAVDFAGNISNSVLHDFSVVPLGLNQHLLIVESYLVPNAFPQIAQIVTLSDVNDQFAVAKAARALANSVWELQGQPYNIDVGWSGRIAQLRVSRENSSEIGYALNSAAIRNGASRELSFHIDEIARRGLHDACETANNFGVIAGTMAGNYLQCPVANWGRFYIVTP